VPGPLRRLTRRTRTTAVIDRVGAGVIVGRCGVEVRVLVYVGSGLTVQVAVGGCVVGSGSGVSVGSTTGGMLHPERSIKLKTSSPILFIPHPFPQALDSLPCLQPIVQRACLIP